MRIIASLPALTLGIAALVAGPTALVAADSEAPPNVLLITVDALRADRISAYGYERTTSPNIDRLIARGAKFTQARTVEPLTSPAMCSVFTSTYPHDNGATRNGLRMRPDLPSLPILLQSHGYRTAAVISNWTLKNKLSGLGEHFERYDEVMKRRRWFGLFNPEANAESMLPGRWVDTGDVGHLRSGRLHLESRMRDMIIRGGENIFPAEIENRIELHPEVAEVAVYGVDDRELGQRVKAVIIPIPGASPDEDSIRQFAADTLAYFKVPEIIEIRKEPLPRNATGKVMKHVLAGQGENTFVED